MLKRDCLKLAAELGFNKNAFVLIGCGMWANCCRITAEVATEILAKRNRGNRTPKEKSIAKYARDMENDRWKTTHEAIAFADDGQLRDGQNRLYAIVRSGKAQTILVILGINAEAVTYIDQGKPRSAKDAADFWGVEATRNQLATVKNAFNGFRHITASLSNPEQLDLLKDSQEGLDFLSENIKSVRGVTSSAAVLGAILRAYYYYHDQAPEIARLKKFCRILSDGQYGSIDADSAPYRLREKLLGSEKFYGQLRTVYGFTEFCLVKFLDKKPVKKVQSVKFEQFPWEDEIHESSEAEEAAV